MNNAPIDVLLQLPIPRTEPAPPARPRDDASAFGNHFRQASDTGSVSPPPSPASSQRPPESSTGETKRRPPAQDERPRQPHAESSARPATESESPDAAAVDEEAQAIENEFDDDASLEDPAEAVAALLAAHPLTEATQADADTKQTTHEATRVESAVAAKLQPRAKGSKQAAHQSATDAKSEHPSQQAETTPTDADLPADAAKADTKSSDAKPQNMTPASATHATESTSSESVEPTGDVKASQAKPGRDSGTHAEVAASKTAEKPAAAHATAANSIEPSRAARKSAVESVRDDAPKKSEKKSSARTSTVSSETTSPATERPANIPRAADAPITPPVAANAQQQLPVADVTATAAANANGKDSAGATKQGLLSPFARLERGAHGTRGTQRTAAGEPAHHVDPARFVSRVARAIHTAQERGGPLQLRLSPPELGAMRLELTVNQGALTATIETDNSTTRQLLLDNLPALRERLAEQNVKIERFDVDVRRDPSGGQQNTAPQDRGSQQQQRTSTPHGASRRDAALPIADQSQPLPRSITNTSINVVA